MTGEESIIGKQVEGGKVGRREYNSRMGKPVWNGKVGWMEGNLKDGETCWRWKGWLKGEN